MHAVIVFADKIVSTILKVLHPGAGVLVYLQDMDPEAGVRCINLQRIISGMEIEPKKTFFLVQRTPRVMKSVQI